MEQLGNLIHMLPYLVPLIVVEAILVAIALVDLARRKRVTGGKKLIWVLVTVGVQFIGPVVYLVAGRKEESSDCD